MRFKIKLERDRCTSHRNEIREKPRNHINNDSIIVVPRDDNGIYWDSPIVKGFSFDWQGEEK